MSTQLVWQLINKHNSFKVKNRTGDRVILSSEPGNLYNKHSYKHSGYFDRLILLHHILYGCHSLSLMMFLATWVWQECR